MSLSLERYCGPFTVKLSVNPFTIQKIANLKTLSHACKSSILLSPTMLIWKRHFGAPTGKPSLNAITTQIMQVWRFLIIIATFWSSYDETLSELFYESFKPYYCSDIFELLRWNAYLTPLRPKPWLIWKIPLDTSQSSCLVCFRLLTIRHFAALTVKCSFHPITTQNMVLLQ